MRFLLKLIFWPAVLGIIVMLAIILVPVRRSAPISQAAAIQKPEAGRGQYLALLADCGACHTADKNKPFGGGKPVASPFGNIYASNISPSRQYGIGNYTLEDFRAALRDGLRPNGSHLYPAMPYDSYRKLTDADIAALYNYFMNEVRPVEQQAPATALIFPFNQRWGVRIWNWFALSRDVGFAPRYNNGLLNRGAYIVESLGHCGACHTPRDILFRQKGYDPSNPHFLTGAVLDGWFAPDLRDANSAIGAWSAEDLKFYLTTGRNRFTAAAGPMNEAIEHSLQYMKPEDSDAVVAYLQSIKTDDGAAVKRVMKPTAAMLTAADPSMPLGARLYLDNCAACHFVSGLGAPEVFPQLDGASIVNAKEPGGLIHVILAGSRLPSTA